MEVLKINMINIPETIYNIHNISGIILGVINIFIIFSIFFINGMLEIKNKKMLVFSILITIINILISSFITLGKGISDNGSTTVPESYFVFILKLGCIILQIVIFIKLVINIIKNKKKEEP